MRNWRKNQIAAALGTLLGLATAGTAAAADASYENDRAMMSETRSNLGGTSIKDGGVGAVRPSEQGRSAAQLSSQAAGQAQDSPAPAAAT
ncbi:MAG: hypothetical protein K6A65_08070, partial [Succinivibrionaceae bacterium]|nr:hypothetical protein [Succinivibrionaceae bacterium]